MKTMRRYFAMLLTLIMSFSLVTSAAAAETKTNVQIKAWQYQVNP